MDNIAQTIVDAIVTRLTPLLAAGSLQPRLLTVEQAAIYLGRTKKAIRCLIAANGLPVVRSDSRVMLDVQDLDAWINANKYEG